MSVWWQVDDPDVALEGSFAEDRATIDESKGDFVGHPFRGNQHTGSRVAVDNMVRALREPDGGFTINPQTGRQPRTGYAVGARGHSSITAVSEFMRGEPGHEKGRSIIRAWLRRERPFFKEHPDAKIGGWHNPKTHEIVLDPSFVVKDRTKAIELAHGENQQAIADLRAIHAGDWDNAIIDTGGTGD